MPYSKNEDLPAPIKAKLPDHAQTIYRKAFNNALSEVKKESSAFMIAWAAVKRAGYRKTSSGKWTKI